MPPETPTYRYADEVVEITKGQNKGEAALAFVECLEAIAQRI